MFGALRRCPASFSRTAVSSGLPSRIVRARAFAPSSTAWLAQPASRVGFAAFHESTQWRQEAAVAEQTAAPNTDVGDAAPKGTIEKFADLETHGLVHPNVVRTITDKMGIHTMTEVQRRTINEALRGTDIVGQAKTGTGKTLGFLVPVIQNIINKEPALGERPRGYQRARSDDIRAIIISPTRELAEQIAVEAKKVTSNTGLIVQAAVGGTQKRMMLQKTQREGCHILVGTPGRLFDLLSDEYSRIAAPKLSCLVMDEADRLLEHGFQAEINEIKKCLPGLDEVDRQTMMFSATIPREVVGLVRSTLKPGFHYVKCVRDGEEPTHERVPQKVVVLNGLENQLPALYELCTKHIQQAKTEGGRPFKAIVYFSTTNEVKLASSIFNRLAYGAARRLQRDSKLGNTRILEIHSKLTQGARTTAADNFRVAKSAILFSSDVTARGMDFPDVTHVIQIGVPRMRETYIHRLGRTARAGKEGEGWIFVSPLDESQGRRKLGGIPLVKDMSLETAHADMTKEGEVSENAAEIFKEIFNSAQRVPSGLKQETYEALFNAYGSTGDRPRLVQAANRLSQFGWGMEEPPMVGSRFLRAHGLSGVRGLNVGESRGFGEDSADRNDPFGHGQSDEDDPFGDNVFGSGRGSSGSSGRYSGSGGGFSQGGGFSRGRSDRGSSDRGGRYGSSSGGGFSRGRSDRGGSDRGGKYGSSSGGGRFGTRSSGDFGGRSRGRVQESAW